MPTSKAKGAFRSMQTCATTGCEQPGPVSVRPLGRPPRVAGATRAAKGVDRRIGSGPPDTYPSRTYQRRSEDIHADAEPARLYEPRIDPGPEATSSFGRPPMRPVDPIASGSQTIISGHLQTPFSNAPCTRAREAEKPGVDGLWDPWGLPSPAPETWIGGAGSLDTSPDQQIRTFQLLRLLRELTSSLQLRHRVPKHRRDTRRVRNHEWVRRQADGNESGPAPKNNRARCAQREGGYRRPSRASGSGSSA